MTTYNQKKREGGECLIESSARIPLTLISCAPLVGCPDRRIPLMMTISQHPIPWHAFLRTDDVIMASGLWSILNVIVPKTESKMQICHVLERKIATQHNLTSGIARCFIEGLYCIFQFLFSGCQTNGRILVSGHPQITHNLEAENPRDLLS